MPAIFDAAVRHPLVHVGEHALFLAAGLLLWWPLLDDDPARGAGWMASAQLVYVIVAMLPMTLIGAYLDRDPTLFYPAYASPRSTSVSRPLIDQQQAGAIMWVVGTTIMVVVGLWSSMAAMVAAERRQQRRETHTKRTLAPPRSGADDRRRMSVRWLTRPSRIPASVRLRRGDRAGDRRADRSGRRPRSVGAVERPAFAGRSRRLAAAPATRREAPGRPGRRQSDSSFPDSPALQARGLRPLPAELRLLPRDRCCRATHGRGALADRRRSGSGRLLPVDRTDAAVEPRDEPMRSTPAFDRTQIDALVAYIARFGGPAAPTADPAGGSLAAGLPACSRSTAPAVTRSSPAAG